MRDYRGRFCSDLSRRLLEAPPPADLTGCLVPSDRNAIQPAGLIPISGVFRLRTDPPVPDALPVARRLSLLPKAKGAQAMSTTATQQDDVGQQTSSDPTAIHTFQISFPE